MYNGKWSNCLHQKPSGTRSSPTILRKLTLVNQCTLTCETPGWFLQQVKQQFWCWAVGLLQQLPASGARGEGSLVASNKNALMLAWNHHLPWHTNAWTQFNVQSAHPWMAPFWQQFLLTDLLAMFLSRFSIQTLWIINGRFSMWLFLLTTSHLAIRSNNGDSTNKGSTPRRPHKNVSQQFFAL